MTYTYCLPGKNSVGGKKRVMLDVSQYRQSRDLVFGYNWLYEEFGPVDTTCNYCEGGHGRKVETIPLCSEEL